MSFQTVVSTLLDEDLCFSISTRLKMSHAAAEIGSVLLNTAVEDTHMEFNPQVAPSTSADKEPILVQSDDINSEIPIAREPDRPIMMNGQPLPDLRHEQTYLAAINRTNGSYLSIARVTLIDFLLWPTITQFAYVLGLNGFRYLRTGSTRSGRKFGELIRDFLNVGGVLD